jgi:hypothetical protein
MAESTIGVYAFFAGSASVISLAISTVSNALSIIEHEPVVTDLASGRIVANHAVLHTRRADFLSSFLLNECSIRAVMHATLLMDFHTSHALGANSGIGVVADQSVSIVATMALSVSLIEVIRASINALALMKEESLAALMAVVLVMAFVAVLGASSAVSSPFVEEAVTAFSLAGVNGIFVVDRGEPSTGFASSALSGVGLAGRTLTGSALFASTVDRDFAFGAAADATVLSEVPSAVAGDASLIIGASFAGPLASLAFKRLFGSINGEETVFTLAVLDAGVVEFEVGPMTFLAVVRVLGAFLAVAHGTTMAHSLAFRFMVGVSAGLDASSCQDIVEHLVSAFAGITLTGFVAALAVLHARGASSHIGGVVVPESGTAVSLADTIFKPPSP